MRDVIMLDGKPAIFISCSEQHKAQAAYPFRDVIEANGFIPIIVADAPKLVDSWTPEEKVEAYVNRSDVLLALCTRDDELRDGSWRPRENIIDEVTRARNKPHLRDRICVLKEASVQLPSNINPVYDRLDPNNIPQAMIKFSEQMAIWGFDFDPASSGDSSAKASGALKLLEGLGVDEIRLTQQKVRTELPKMMKKDQRDYVRQAIGLVRGAPHWEQRAMASHLLEAIVEIDPGLVTIDVIDELSRHADFSVRSSAAVILFILALNSPGTVPLDIVQRLGTPSSEDWYVFTPALNALKQLGLTRPEAISIMTSLCDSTSDEDAEYAATAFRELAEVKPEVVPVDAVERLIRTRTGRTKRMAEETNELLRQITDDRRQSAYSPFSPF